MRKSPLEHAQPWPRGCLIPAGGSITDVQWLLSHGLVDSKADHLWGTSPVCTKQPQDHGCARSRCDFLTNVQWLLSTRSWDSNHRTSGRSHLLQPQHHGSVCMLIVIPSQMFSDYYLHNHERQPLTTCGGVTCLYPKHEKFQWILWHRGTIVAVKQKGHAHVALNAKYIILHMSYNTL